MDPGADRRRRLALGALLLAAAVVRVGYVVAQPEVDPNFDRPILDGEVYVETARAWLRGDGGPPGAFYLAPGYPVILAVLLGISGGSFAFLYLAQHAAVLASALLAARIARRAAGDLAGWCAAAFLLGYHPLLFFASRPLGEVFGVLGLFAAVAVLGDGARPRRGAAGGALLGATAIVRPNALAILPLWAGWAWLRRKPRTAAAVAAACLVVLAPVAVRNRLASGSFVPVSSNAGLTLYHGNGPGADGVFTPVEGMGARVVEQREEATRLAHARSGIDLDPVDADRWWGREALRARLADPAGTVRLVARKVLLTISGRELGLDEAPALDRDPWRLAAPVPFAILLGLTAACPWLARRREGAGLGAVWTALVGLAATPVVFYVSSRYRLPLAALMCVPAGVAVGLGVEAFRRREGFRAWGAATTAVAVVAVSAAAPWGASADREMRATAHANRAVAWMERGRTAEARADLERARALDPDGALAWYNLGVLFEREGRMVEAAAAYRRVPPDDPVAGEAAGNLGGILVRAGRAGEAVAVLEAAVRARPGHRPCWSNLVVAHLAAGDPRAAGDAARRAADAGVALDPELLATVAAAAGAGAGDGR